MTKIWVLTELYYPEQTSTGYILTHTAEGLAQEYDVGVITGPPTNFFERQKALPYEEKNNVEIYRCQGTSFNKDIFWGRIINLLTRSITIFWKAFFYCKKGETILVVTNPPLLPFFALLLKWLKGCNFVLLIHDLYPEILVATGLYKASSFIVKIGHLLNRVLYKEAMKIITLGRDMTKLVQAKLDADDKKITCITNWAEVETIRPDDRFNNETLNNLNLTNKFVFLYAGNIGRTHAIEDIAEAAKFLELSNNIHFLFIGFGAKKQWLENHIKNQDIKNITVVAPRPDRAEQSISLNACDVAIITFIPGMAGISVPSRMYNQMAAGKPIIAVTDDWSELAEVVRENEIGWVIKPGDITTLVETIKYAAEHPEVCTKMGEKAATVAQTKYSFFETDLAYKKLFKEIEYLS
jgi:colanic acid biosynthesis glycosyl transferase WcaI